MFISGTAYKLIARLEPCGILCILGFPTKDDDAMLVRTPDLAMPMEDDLAVHGRGYFGKYAPLTSRNVAQILENE